MPTTCANDAPTLDTSDVRVCCAACDKTILPDDTRHDIDDAPHCAACAAECHECGNATLTDDLELIEVRRGYSRHTDTRSLCESCRDDLHRCDDCGCYSSDTNHCWSEHDVCDRCIENYSTCVHCDGVYCCDSGPSCCCSKVIRPYSEKVSSSPIGTGPIYFGVELEVTAVNGDAEDKASEVQSVFGEFAIMKADSSVGDEGFEIVTRPADLANHRKQWGAFFNSSVVKRLRSWDAETCGLHVHVSRRPLTALQLGKILCFVNDPAHTGFIKRIAGRDSEQWAARCKKKLTDGMRGKPCGARYQAINLCNTSTIEFRIFRGTLKRESFFKCLEFVAAVVRWAGLPNGLTPSLDSFRSFVESERKDYPHLFEFMFPDRKAVSAVPVDDGH